jgi:SET and MYND domain-containing protein 4
MDRKNNSLAKKYRNAGNVHFRDLQFFEALMVWNRSLCVAENGSESIPIAYGNRSAVYLRLKLFDQCLENIRLARKFNYPQEKMEKLNKREEECKKMMETEISNPDHDPFNYFKLSHPPSKENPEIVDCLELRNNKKFGNHVVTTRDLKTGDVIAMEVPFFKAGNTSARHYRCNFCLKDPLMNLLPCTGCAMGES